MRKRGRTVWTHRAIHDIFVIGGGINGCGIARDAAGRGYSVFLCRNERSGQRDVLRLDQADPWRPALSRTLRVPPGARSADGARGAVEEWRRTSSGRCASCCRMPRACGRPGCLRLGLFLYDHIGGRKLLPATRTLDMTQRSGRQAAEAACSNGLRIFRWLGQRCAAGGAERARRRRPRRDDPHPHEGASSARREKRLWTVRVEDARAPERPRRSGRGLSSTPPAHGSTTCCQARVGQNDVHNVRLVQGSHIVVPKKFDDPRAYFFQNKDGRIIFAIPYEDDFTLIGTTDQDYDGDPGDGHHQRRRDRLSVRCGERIFRRAGQARRHRLDLFRRVRPLYDDGASKAQEATRDYVLKADRRRRRRRRSSTSSAARSPPIAGWPNPCSRRSRSSRQARQALDGRRRAAGRRFSADRLRRRGGKAEGVLSVSRYRLMRAG